MDALGHVRVGGTAPGEGNVIVGNDGAGVAVMDSTGSAAVLGNVIRGNTGLGIDLDRDGVTPNDALDADSGGNGLQNFPLLTSAYSSAGTTGIFGSFDSAASTTYRLEFFSAPTPDAAGHGGGVTFLGYTTVTTDAGGHANVGAVFGSVSVAAGEVITATATVDLGGGVYGATSEFAANVVVSATAPGPVVTVPGLQSLNEDGSRTFSGAGGNAITVSDGTAADVRLQLLLAVNSGRLTLASTTGVVVASGADGSGSMVLWGTESALNAALDGLRYDPASNANGSFALTTTVSSAADLAGLYPFDDGTALDRSAGTAQDGSLLGGATVVADGTRGNVLQLNGAGDHVQINSDFGNPADLTLAAWVNIDLAQAARADLMHIGFVGNVVFDPAAGGTLTGSTHDGAQWTSLSAPAALAGTGWHHLAFTWNGATGTGTLYLDGAALATSTSHLVEAGAPMGQTRIGSDWSGSFWHNGRLDDARVYTRALSPAEVSVLSRDQAAHSASVTLQVAAVNDAPVGIDASIAVVEDVPRSLSAADFGFTDVEGHALASVTISTLPIAGSLTYGGVAVTAGQVIAAANLGNLQWVSSPNQSGAPYASFTFQVADSGGTALGGADTDATPNTITFNVSAVNDAPQLGLGLGTVTHTEGAGPTVLNPAGNVFDAELGAADNFAGSTLTLVRQGGANPQDHFSATGTLAPLVGGGALVVGGTTIGTVTTNAGGQLVLSFGAAATQALVNDVVRQIAYTNASDEPPASVQVAWTFDDGNAGAQGAGGAAQVVGSVLVNITATNDAPVLNLDPDNSEGGAHDGGITVVTGPGGEPVRLSDRSDATAFDPDGAEITSLRLTPAGVLDGANERLVVGDGTRSGPQVSVALSGVAAAPQTLVLGATTFTVSYDGTRVVVARQGGGVIGATDLDTLLRGIGYQHVGWDGTTVTATAGTRTVSVVAHDASTGSTPAVATVQVTAQPRFSFGATLYQVFDTALMRLDTGTGQYALVATMATGLNGMGYNPLDGYAYGLSAAGDLLRVGADGSQQLVAGGYGDSRAGAVTADGRHMTLEFSAQSPDRLVITDLATGQVTRVVTTSNSLDAVGDIAVIGNTAYGVQSTPRGTPENLVAIDLTTGVVTTSPITGLDGHDLAPDGLFGAAWTVQDTRLIVYENKTGTLYEIQGHGTAAPTARIVTVAGHGGPDSDGFAFPDAPLADMPPAINLDPANISAGNDDRGHDATFIENGAAVAVVAPGVSIGDNGEADLTRLTLVVSGVADGAAEVLAVAGQDFALDADRSLNGVLVGGTRVNIQYVAATGTFSVSHNAGPAVTIPHQDLEALLRGITYRHGSENPTAGVRSLSITVTDATAQTGVEAVAGITVQPVNDAPTTAAVTLPAWPEDGGPRLVTQAELLALATDVDGGPLVARNLQLAAGAGTLVDHGDGTWTFTPAPDDHSGVSFTYTIDDGAGGSVAGTATLDLTPVNDLPTGLPVVQGTAAEDQVLLADTGGIADADGLGFYGYQWQRNGVDVAGATTSSYGLTDADVGARMRVVVRWVDGDGTPEALVSAETTPIAAVNDAPVGAPVIVGQAVEDRTLTADVSGIVDADGVGTLSFQWLRNGQAIAGATGAGHLLGDDDVGQQISVQVRYTDGQGFDELLGCAAVGPVTNVNDAPTGATPAEVALDENALGGTVVAQLQAVDVDPGDNHTFTMLDNPGGSFLLDRVTGTLRVAPGAVLDFESTPNQVLRVRITDAAGAIVDQDIVVRLHDVNETADTGSNGGGSIEPQPGRHTGGRHPGGRRSGGAAGRQRHLEGLAGVGPCR